MFLKLIKFYEKMELKLFITLRLCLFKFSESNLFLIALSFYGKI